MKAGAENKIKQRIAIVLGIVAILAVGRTVISLASGGGDTPEATVVATAPAKGNADPAAAESLDPRLHLDLLASSEAVKYEGQGKNIFRAVELDIPPVKVPPLLSKQQSDAQAALDAAPKVYVPPPPPPINLKFFGFSNTKGEKPKAFLSQGDDVWIAHEGDVVNRQYKIVHISPNAVEVEDLLNNNHQSIRLTQG
jgi:hypothetical protein